MKKFYYLSTCNTCQRILGSLDPEERIPRQDVKFEPLTAEQLDQLYQLSGSYEELFNRRSRQYRARNLHEASLGEEDYRKLILEEYSFLKRPVLLLDDKIFVGNGKKTVEAAHEALNA